MEYTAEAFFSIDAPSEQAAKGALAAAVDRCDEAMRYLGLPEDVSVQLCLEDTNGNVEEA